MLSSKGAGGQYNAVYESQGLHPRHAYSILDVRDVQGSRLLCLQSPWGHCSWNGSWSNKWTHWLGTPVGTQLRLHSRSEGVFWMEYSDLIRYLDSVDICKGHADWQEAWVQGCFPSSSGGPWRHGPQGAGAGIPGVRCLPRGQQRADKKFVNCDMMLEPGKYAVVCSAFNHWGPTPGLPATQTRHGGAHRGPANAITLLTESRGVWQEGHECLTCYYLMHGWARLVVFMENWQHKSHLHVQSDCSDSFNEVSTCGRLCTQDHVLPLNMQFLVILSQLESHIGFSITHRLVHRKAAQAFLSDRTASGGSHSPPLTSEVNCLLGPQPL
ncbi:hypothetical protein CB1_042835002 [Camelus ferus]|nr:hypothetical protein CB1_042835002 [Camelus ferus]